MHYDAITYRPPYEASSLILQVTTGCSHNACTFCSMYRDTQFSVSPIEEVTQDLAEAARAYPQVRRVFLANGDAFCLPATELAAIADLIHEALPQVESIGCYARIPNVTSKNDDELRLLSRKGYADLNIGVESALDDVLAFHNKGYDVDTARRALNRLNEVGLSFNLNIIIAAAGPTRILEHAAANAALVNDCHPTLIFVSPLHVDPGTPLERLIAHGAFEECTLGDYLKEEIAFLEELTLNDCVFFGLHVSNPVPVAGMLSRDKEELIEALRQGYTRIPVKTLASHPSKGSEGRLLGLR